MLELEDLKRTKPNESNYNDQTKFNCLIGDEKSKSQHVRRNHFKDEVSQAEVTEVNLKKMMLSIPVFRWWSHLST